MTSSVAIIPVYRGLTVAGKVLERDPQGRMYHTCVADTTLPEKVEVVYELL
ncbi:MAG: hypothetical protein KF905_04180 [Flavobacteriales bacterium]|nr:hypothetical protein [Flavobacteriales bacterium]